MLDSRSRGRTIKDQAMGTFDRSIELLECKKLYPDGQQCCSICPLILCIGDNIPSFVSYFIIHQDMVLDFAIAMVEEC
jgi:hypothetical protein